ncbi:MAG TPA: hypothetical protein DEA55_02995 [Rhodospirillaceae bacterium]|nr:hypothetical protein [Rhodospirillaceae bacterium]
MSEDSKDTKAGKNIGKQGGLAAAAASGRKKTGDARQVKLGRVKGDLIGVVVLAVGVAAMIGVSYLAYVRWYGGSQPEQQAPEDEFAEMESPEEEMPPEENPEGAYPDEESDIPPAEESGSESAAPPERTPEPAPIPEKIPDQSTLALPSEKQLAGSWTANFGSDKAFLQISGNNAFQLIFTSGAEGGVRKYSRGMLTYDSSTGSLILQPDSALGEPKAVEGVTYKILTMRRYQVNLYKDKDESVIYWKPGTIEGRSDQVHPLFLFTNRQDSGIKWTKSR